MNGIISQCAKDQKIQLSGEPVDFNPLTTSDLVENAFYSKMDAVFTKQGFKKEQAQKCKVKH